MSPALDSMERGQKRKRDQKDGIEQMSMGSLLSRVRNDDEPTAVTSALDALERNLNSQAGTKDDIGEGWTTVGPSAKKQKKDKQQANYPAISHSANARLQSFVKISDLQNLVLYLLADGSGPQWVSVKHKNNIERVVCLLVPGLEAGMFDGKIPLEAQDGDESAGQTVQDGSEQAEVTLDMSSNGELTGKPVLPSSKPQKKLKLNIHPDDYYPIKLVPEKLPDPLAPLSTIFPHLWPVKTPGEYNRMHSPLYAMLNAPLPKSKEDKKTKGPKPPREGNRWQNKRTPVTTFLTSKDDLADNGFSLHPAHQHSDAERELEKARRYKNCRTAEDGWIDILPEFTDIDAGIVPPAEIEGGSMTAGRDVLVLDCEMVTTQTEKFALARLSILNWAGETVLDELVKPPDPVTDYLTPYSGITKELLDPVTTTLSDIHAKLSALLTPRTILAGHSLDSDLRALRISFPFIIDTTLLYPHPKGPPQKSSLKWLSQKYLSREIQNRGASKGHDSIEDARACLDLIKQKCEKGPQWGTSEATSESIFKRLSRSSDADDETASDNLASTITTTNPGAVVDWGDPKRGFGAAAHVAIACESDADVVAGVSRAVLGSNSPLLEPAQRDMAKAQNIPPEGCAFTWARLRELEALRGWWNRTKTIDAAERLAKTVEQSNADGSLGPQALGQAVSRTVSAIKSIWDALPPKTALLLYSGSGDPRELRRLTELHAQFKREYQTLKWDELSIKWTDVEEQQLKVAAMKARMGLGCVVVK